jgi:hypothetical protein
MEAGKQAEAQRAKLQFVCLYICSPSLTSLQSLFSDLALLLCSASHSAGNVSGDALVPP